METTMSATRIDRGSTETTIIYSEGGDLVFERTFDATIEQVWKAFTDPALVPRWWGPHGTTTRVVEMDVRPGGQWRYVQSDANGNEFGFRGIYHDAEAPHRLVSTFEFEGMPGHVALDTLTLEDVDGKTRYTSVSVFQSVADRDGMVQSGMESGARETLERLETLLEGLRTRA